MKIQVDTNVSTQRRNLWQSKKQKVTIFNPYPFEVGQKIRIEGSGREGDWEVTDVTESKVTLRCPSSKKEYTWDLFCYFTEEKDDFPWPNLADADA